MLITNRFFGLSFIRIQEVNLSLLIRRQLTLLASKHTRISSHHDDHSNDEKILRSEILLSKENQKRAMECMKKTSTIGLKTRQIPVEKSFAAVLICLCSNERNGTSILYTRRSGRLTRHIRQISFPGGIKEPDDADFIDCALRETEEEIGLSRDRIEVWGSGTLITPPHTAAIMPVVATVDNLTLKELNINEHEVEEAFLIPVKDLVHPKTLKHTQFRGGFSTPNFVVGHYKIWGITGFITNTFLQCLIPTDVKRLKHHIKYVRPFKHKI